MICAKYQGYCWYDIFFAETVTFCVVVVGMDTALFNSHMKYKVMCCTSVDNRSLDAFIHTLHLAIKNMAFQVLTATRCFMVSWPYQADFCMFGIATIAKIKTGLNYYT